ncbi:MAG: MFS transporter, partial [Clostridia bacterium]|nr:MFS transporter [Clostridia bacterium]
MEKKKRRAGRNKSRTCIYLLLFLSWFTYTAGSVGRMDYSASMVAIIAETGASKDSAGMVASFFFFAYGAGQLVNGLLCHKYNTRYAIFAALILSCGMNFVIPFLNSVSVMKYLWLVNGLAQSVLWSSLVKLQAEYLNDKDIAKCILIMSTTTAAGTFIAYGISA